MSERTTIGGTVYESVGSTSSNLLLKCNGTARIQWGNKLIDLIKNGKIASESDLEQIFIVSDESEIESDGVYVVSTEDTSHLWVSKDGAKYNLTGAELYISASKKLDITVEQQHQALENIGMYYNTLEEVEKSGMKNGLVYVMDTKNLYTIKDGIVEEFEAKVKTVTVEKEGEVGEVINSSVQIVLSVLDEEYLILSDLRITANCSIHVKNHALVGSEGADANTGYRLYIKGDVSYLDVDKINVRHGLSIPDYLEITYSELILLINSNTMKPHLWYLITDFQNHWKLPANLVKFNRPILVRALTGSTFYKEGQLFKDRRVSILYDPFYNELLDIVEVEQPETPEQPDEPEALDETPETGDVIEGVVTVKMQTEIQARGRITWMRDSFGNEANFDFLDYSDVNGNPLTTLHASVEDDTLDSSIFPRDSYNNKLTITNLKGTVVKDKVINDEGTNIIDFLYDDSLNQSDLEEGAVLPRMIMHDNVIVCNNLVLPPSCANFSNNTFNLLDNNVINGDIVNCSFNLVIGNTFNCSFDNTSFKNVTNCIFQPGVVKDLTCTSDVYNAEVSEETQPIIYDTSVTKTVHFDGNTFLVSSSYEQTFSRGMIVMHSGISPIPTGWAVCDGNSYTYNGVTSTTPNLVNRFIKAVATADQVKAVNNTDLNDLNELTLLSSHLPNTIYHGGDAGELENSNNSTSFLLTGEDNNFEKFGNTPIKIEPNYYSLIFIMKL